MDPIADMFSQIKNAQGARQKKLVVSYSKIKWAILEILKAHQQISGLRLVEEKSKNPSSRQIEIELKQNFLNLKRVSRPGRRVYIASLKIPRPKRPRAMVVISTSQGLFEGEEARKKGLGGELIAEIS